MRRLRLKAEDKKFAYLYSNAVDDEAAQVKDRISGQQEKWMEASFTEASALITEAGHFYQVGFVPCTEEALITLPDKGNVVIMGCEGGFIVAAECESWKAG